MLKLLTDNPDLLVLIGTALGWLYHKVRGDKQASLKDTLWHSLEGVAIKLAERDDAMAFARDKLTAAAWQALSRLGVKRSKATESIVAALVDRGVTEVRKRLLERKQLEAKLAAQLGTVAAKAGGVLDAFTPKGTLPKLGEGLEGEFQVEVVKP